MPFQTKDRKCNHWATGGLLEFGNKFTSKKQKKHVVPLQGLNPMPFRAEARKCNHWALRGLLELGSKFNGTYMHTKCNFY